MTKPADLYTYLFEGQPHRLAPDLKRWMDASPRFTAFVETYRDKIRKKVRLARAPDEALDLRCELEVAHCLLEDRRFNLTYEPYASAKRRGPDFAAAYRIHQIFNLEVTRPRTSPRTGPSEAGETPLQQKEKRLLHTLLGKLGQMQPGMPNLLVIFSSEELAQTVQLERWVLELKARVEKKDPAFYAATPYTAPADFYKDFLRLHGILLWAAAPQLWVNKAARPAFDEKVLRLVSTLASGGTTPDTGGES